jgi:hypothetical protein
MNFSGTLIDDLMATVERAEQRMQADEALVEGMGVETLRGGSSFVETLFVETWSVSVQENRDYDSKFIGVA